MSSIYEALKRTQTSAPVPTRADGQQNPRGKRTYWVVAAAVIVSSALTGALIYGLGTSGQRTTGEPAAVHADALNPERIIELMNKAERLRRKNSMEEAIAAYRSVVELAPGYPEAYLQLGSVYYDAGRFDEALSAFSTARELKPDDARLLNNMGSVLLAKDNAAEALSYFVQARRNSADYVEPLYNMACAYARLNRKDAALSSLRQAAGMQPEVRLWARRDPDLASLKGDRDFESIVNPKD